MKLDISQILSNFPLQAWTTLGVVVGSLMAMFGTYLTNKASLSRLQLQLDHDRTLKNSTIKRERLEELYVLVSKWLDSLFIYYLRFREVMQKKSSSAHIYEFLENNLSTNDFSPNRIDMIIDIYGEELKELYKAVIDARTNVNKIIDDYNLAYKQGQLGWESSLIHIKAENELIKTKEEFIKAEKELEIAGEKLKAAIAACAKIS